MTEKEQEELLDDLRLEFNERNRMPDMIEQPSWETIKEELEGRFKVVLYGRTFKDSEWDKGTHALTQYSPLFIDLRWNAEACKGKEGYYLIIAPRDTAKPFYSSGYHPDPFETVITELSKYCKKEEPRQVSLF